MKRVVFCLPLIVAGAALGTSTSVLANDFPTDARVQFVFECMHDHGGSSYANLYHCSCTIDRIADAMPYQTYVEADTYERGRHAAGERGGILREGDIATHMRTLLETAEKNAETRCFPRDISEKKSKQ